MAKAPAKSTKSAKADDADQLLPTPEEALAVFEPARTPRHARSRDILLRLREAPPQVLVMEGGTVEERAAMALWYAALHSCPEPTPSGGPCLACPVCQRIGAGFHADVPMLDGRAGSIGIDTVRELRASLSEAPRGNGKRVVLILEAQALGVEAANALLKSLEEPRPNLCFALLAPQRERLLPTLVSRGWTLTLTWPEFSNAVPADLTPWVRALDDFLTDGKGLFALTAVKGALDADLVRRLILCLQKSLAAVMVNPTAHPDPLAPHLARIPDRGYPYLTDIMAQAQKSLDAGVNPALVFDWLAVRFFQATHLAKR